MVTAEYPADGDIIGASQSMRDILTTVAKVADSMVSVLICGESGTGKELLAQRIHATSRRAAGAYVPINCGALPEQLAESEIFGYERGAFTGAAEAKPGLVEEAHGGTFFMDEVGELSMPLQVKFLRVLEDGRFRRLGSNCEREVDLRLVCATNADLGSLVEDGSFRLDLYYRIQAFTIHVPPLRDRRQDVTPLVGHFVNTCARRHGLAASTVTPDAMTRLHAHDWPGNVRELQSVIERALILADGDPVRPVHLPPGVRESVGYDGGSEDGVELTYKEARQRHLEAFDRWFLAEVIGECGGNITHAAKRTGLNRRSLQRLLAKYGISAREPGHASENGRG